MTKVAPRTIINIIYYAWRPRLYLEKLELGSKYLESSKIVEILDGDSKLKFDWLKSCRKCKRTIRVI